MNKRNDRISLCGYGKAPTRQLRIVVVVLTLPRIIKSVVTGQAPVTLELRNTPGGKHKQPKVVHAYFITADAIHIYIYPHCCLSSGQARKQSDSLGAGHP